MFCSIEKNANGFLALIILKTKIIEKTLKENIGHIAEGIIFTDLEKYVKTSVIL